MDNIVLMYGCPNVDFDPNKLDPIVPIIPNIPDNALIEHYKERFAELFNEMNIELGKCKSVIITEGIDKPIVVISF